MINSRCFFMALLSTIAVTQSVVGFPEFKSSFGNGKHHGIIQNLIKHHLKGLEDRDIWNKVEPHFERPNLIEISIKTFDDEMSEYDGSGDEVLQNEVKQIPVISDIERIKKIAQILEIVGDKVIPLIIDNLPAKSKQTSVPITVDSNEKGLKFLNDLKKELNGVTGGNLEKKVLGE